MADYRPPSFLQPQQYGNFGKSLDDLLNAYVTSRQLRNQDQRLGMEQQRFDMQKQNFEADRGASLIANQGVDTGEVARNPDLLRQAMMTQPPAQQQGPWAGGMNQAPQGVQQPNEDPGVLALRGLLDTHRQSRAMSQRGQMAKIQGEEAGALKDLAQRDLYSAEARAYAGAGGKPMTPNQKAQIEGGMYDDFTRSQIFKDFSDVKASYRNIATLGKGKNGITDVATIYSFIKLIDPGSVVRNEEIKLSANANPLAQRIALAWNNAKSGRLSTEQMNKEILGAAGIIYDQQLKNLNDFRGGFKGRQEQYGISHDIATPDFSIPQAEIDSIRGVQQKGPEPGMIKGGYRFRGGDPANQQSWEKI